MSKTTHTKEDIYGLAYSFREFIFITEGSRQTWWCGVEQYVRVLYPHLQARKRDGGRREERDRDRDREIVVWAFETSKPTPSDVLPPIWPYSPTRQHLINLKQFINWGLSI